MSTAKKIDIHDLNQSERIRPAEQPCDSIVEDQDSLEVTDAPMELVQQRLAACRASPNEGSSWEEVKKEMK